MILKNHITVIIPCHNSTKWVKETLQCLVDQTYRDFDVVLIDDASDDNLKEYIDTLSLNFPYKIFRIDARCAGAARNEGLKYVIGEFIYFIDSDDWITNNFFEFAIETANQYPKFHVISTGVGWGKRDEFIPDENLNITLHDAGKKIPVLVGKQLYRTSIIMENNLRFPLCSHYEDLIFNIHYLHYGKFKWIAKHNGKFIRTENDESTCKQPELNIGSGENNRWINSLPELSANLITMLHNHYTKWHITRYIRRMIETLEYIQKYCV